MGKKCGHKMKFFLKHGMGGHRGHHWGHHGWSPMSDPFSEPGFDFSTKKDRKHYKFGRHMMSDPNWNKVQCTLCWRQIRPLAETEVLECGHLYHRQCLKELFTVSQTGEESQIFCTQCRQQIDTDLVTEYQNRFNSVPTTTVTKISSNEDLTNDMEILNVD